MSVGPGKKARPEGALYYLKSIMKRRVIRILRFYQYLLVKYNGSSGRNEQALGTNELHLKGTGHEGGGTNM